MKTKFLILFIFLSFGLYAQSNTHKVPIVPFSFYSTDTVKAYYFQFTQSGDGFLTDTVNGFTTFQWLFLGYNLQPFGGQQGVIKIIGKAQNSAWYGNYNLLQIASQVIDSFNAQMLRKNNTANLLQISQ